MANWGTELTEGTITCDDCQLAFTLYYQQYPGKDPSVVTCKCGKQLARYNSSREYYIKQDEGKLIQH